MAETIDTLGTKIDNLGAKLDAFSTAVDKRFEQIGGRFEQIDGRFEQIDGRFEQVEGRLEQVGGRFGELRSELCTRIESVDAKLNLVLEGFANLVTKDAANSAAHDRMDGRLDKHDVRLLALERGKTRR